MERNCRKSKKIFFKLEKNKIIKNLEIKNKNNFVINFENNNFVTKKHINQMIKKDYNSIAFTGILHHHKIKIILQFKFFLNMVL